MSTAGLINRYIWMVTTIYNWGPISLKEIQHRFESHFGRGEVLEERTFHRYKDAVEELFGIEIKYVRAHQGYTISNAESINDMPLRKWLLQTFSVNSLLSEAQELKKRIILEDIPSGQQFLVPVIEAMRGNNILLLTYHSFHRDAESTFKIEPWCVKLFGQRWYMLGKSENYEQPRIYALDRVKSLEPTEYKFKLPKRFDAEKFFADYYGIIINDDEFGIMPVALKIDAWQSNFLRTLPLHHSQAEVERNEEYSIFEYRLCPTFDFRQKILSMGKTVSILGPAKLRDMIQYECSTIVDNNSESEYRFRVYKN